MLQLLRKCAPIFLQIVFSDPTLWPEGHSLTAVSVAHILASERHELSHSIHQDAFYTMAYAVSPTLEYDTTCPPFKRDVHAIGWIPAELHIALIEINARRVLGYVAPDWQCIERRILSWQPHLDDSTNDASQHISWLAEQESWRQTLLAYLYMVRHFILPCQCFKSKCMLWLGSLWGSVRRSSGCVSCAADFSAPE